MSKIIVPDGFDAELWILALHRSRMHIDHLTNRPLSPLSEYVGLVGEKAFELLTGIPMDISDRPGGDKGRDFETMAGIIDNKTAQKAYYLLIERDKPSDAEIFVLAQYAPLPEDVKFLGWMYADIARTYDVTQRINPKTGEGYGVWNHTIHNSHLTHMSELYRMMKITPNPIFVRQKPCDSTSILKPWETKRTYL